MGHFYPFGIALLVQLVLVALFAVGLRFAEGRVRMNESLWFEPYDPDRGSGRGEPVDPPAGMPGLAESHGVGWAVGAPPSEPTDPAAVQSLPAPGRMLMPREVPGYCAAVDAGIVARPSVLEPPTPLPGISAAQRWAVVRWSPIGALVVALAVLAPIAGPIAAFAFLIAMIPATFLAM